MQNPLKKILSDKTDSKSEKNDDIKDRTILLHPLTQKNKKQSDQEKIEKIEHHFKAIMETLGLDLEDPSLQQTPNRIAKMYVNEIFSGLDDENKPTISTFDNDYHYREMVIEKDISFYSNCEHHFQPFFGMAHVAYIPGEKVIGLSKLNRIVKYYSARPQVQERLTVQIAEALSQLMEVEDVAVYIVANHLCVSARGAKDTSSLTITSEYRGQFRDHTTREEFLSRIK